MYELIIPNTPITVDLQLVQYGNEQSDVASDSGKNFRWYYLVHLVTKGSGKYTVDNVTYDVKAGDMFLIPPGKTVHYGMEKDYVYYWVGFKGGDAKKFVDCSVFKNTFVTSERFDQALVHIRRLSELTDYGTRSNLKKIGCLVSFLDALNVDDGDEKEKLYEDPLGVTDAAVKFIEQNYQTVTVNAIAEKLKLSRSELYRIFKRELGVSPRDYIINYRLDESLFMIEQTDIKITDVAAICGFYDNNSFTKLFKRKFARTPSSVRKSPINTKYAHRDNASRK